MSRFAIAVASLALAVAGCSSGEKAAEKGAPSAGESAAPSASADGAQVQLEPGEYETTTKVLEFSMAGMPQGQLDGMRAAMSRNAEKSHRYCFTKEDAAEGPKRMVSQMRQGDCKTVRFSSTASSVSGEMQCAFEGGAASTTKFDGAFTKDSSSLTMESDQQMPGMPGKGMHMKMQVDTHRVGECGG